MNFNFFNTQGPPLEPGAIYAILHTRSMDWAPILKHCHFSIGVATDRDTVVRWHATNEDAPYDNATQSRANIWKVECKNYTCTTSKALVLMVRLGMPQLVASATRSRADIGTCAGRMHQGWTTEHLQVLFSQAPAMYVPPEDRARFPDFNCQSWFVNAVRCLANGKALWCPYPHALFDDCITKSLQYEAAVMKQTALYRIEDTTFCTTYVHQ